MFATFTELFATFIEFHKRGLAWVYIKYAKEQKYFEAESRAKNKRIGIWSINNLTPAWEFRRNQQE